MLSAIDAGRKPTTIWRPNRTPNSEAVAPAVLRSRAPRPNPSSPTAVRYRALPSTARATPGWFREVPSCALDRTDWLTRKVAKVAGTNSRGAVRASTTALAHSTGSRRGTATMLVRIMPVAYSLVIRSTPRTPTAICASWTPARPMAVGSKLAMSAGERGGLVTLTREYSTPKPTMGATGASGDPPADGWVRNFGQSERTTVAWVTRRVSSDDVGAGSWVRSVIGRLPWWWVRGTPPHPGWRS